MTMQSIGDAAKQALGLFHRPPLERQDACETHGPFTAYCHLGSNYTRCPTCHDEAQAKREQQRQESAAIAADMAWSRQLQASAIPARFLDRTLANYRTLNEGQAAALAFAREYAAEFAGRHSGRCAIFLGERGTGKTHLACGIALEAMRHGKTAVFTTVSRMVRRIREGKSFDSAESESEAIAVYSYPSLLILDEVGIQSGTEAEARSLFDVINDRYEACKPTIFLSNLDLSGIEQAIGPRLFDRLREDGCQYRVFDWESQRGRNAA